MKWKQAICIASGPSLCREDLLRVRKARWPIIAVNNSWQAVPDCNVLYAGDWQWWSQYYDSIPPSIERWTCCQQAATDFGLQWHKAGGAFNSGHRAIQFAATQGAKRILLLGYDCSLKQGIHWHGKHNMLRNPDEVSIQRWQKHYALLATEMYHAGVNVINCSRHTELECFPQQPLMEALYGVQESVGCNVFV